MTTARLPGDPFAEFDAAYVFGALSPDERQEFEEHLSGCDACAASVRSLAALPGLLARVPQEDLFGPDAEAPPTLLPRLIDAVRKDRHRTRWRTVGAGLLAAACVLGLLVGVLVSRQSTSTPTALPPAISMTEVHASPLTATVRLSSVAWGTKIVMRCTDEPTSTPYPGGSTYWMVITRKDGTQESLASWGTVPDKTLTIEGDTSTALSQIARVEVQVAGRLPILRVTL